MGDQVFKQIAQNLTQEPTPNTVVPLKQYLQWRREYTFHTLKHTQRLGQNFCKIFNISDNILFYEKDHRRADDRIRLCYVA